MMTPERARELLASASPYGTFPWTAEERDEVRLLWFTMSGHSTMHEALCRIANEDRKMTPFKAVSLSMASACERLGDALEGAATEAARYIGGT